MHAGLVDQKALHLLEIGLPVEISARPLPVAGSQAEGGLLQVADNAPRQRGFDGAIPGLKAEILVHHDHRALCLGLFGDLARFFEGPAKGFLADHPFHSCRQRETDSLRMRFGWQDDVEQI